MRQLLSSWWLQVYIVDFGLAYSLPDVAKAQQQGVRGRQVSPCRQALSNLHGVVPTCLPGSLVPLTTHHVMAVGMSCLRLDAC